MDNDLILVMGEGRMVEFGSPAELLTENNGSFAELVDSTGPESSRALRAMAANANKNKIKNQ
jgi:ABC-type antimicrobial peptide transport system ATPase subunit